MTPHRLPGLNLKPTMTFPDPDSSPKVVTSIEQELASLGFALISPLGYAMVHLVARFWWGSAIRRKGESAV